MRRPLQALILIAGFALVDGAIRFALRPKAQPAASPVNFVGLGLGEASRSKTPSSGDVVAGKWTDDAALCFVTKSTAAAGGSSFTDSSDAPATSAKPARSWSTTPPKARVPASVRAREQDTQEDFEEVAPVAAVTNVTRALASAPVSTGAEEVVARAAPQVAALPAVAPPNVIPPASAPPAPIAKTETFPAKVAELEPSQGPLPYRHKFSLPPEGGICTSGEVGGASPMRLKISEENWAVVKSRFSEVKADLRTWLDKHRWMFSASLLASMDSELQSLQLERPPSGDMRDLSWRGIGVWTRPIPGGPGVIKIGGGMVRLIVEDAHRGKFELARLAAQTWTSCELQGYRERTRGLASATAAITSEDPWKSLASCLGIEDQGGCGVGTYSEAGWAVSTAVAKMAEDPGCVIPAFKSLSPEGCLSAGNTR